MSATNRKACPAHGDAEHGREAEELRRGLEALIERAHTSDYQSVSVERLQELLDDVDARDSLAFLERHDAVVRAAAFEAAAKTAEAWGHAPPNPSGRRAELAKAIRALTGRA